MKVKNIEWGAASEPSKDCSYNHIKGETPLGSLLITWKGWKESPSYDAEDCETGSYLFSCSTLDDAKQEAQDRHEKAVLACLDI